MFDWDDLPYFLAVARTRQLSAAARQLRTSHVTVSRRIDRLETALQMRLFERTPRGYELTPNGRRMFPTAERMEQEAERLRAELSGAGAGHRGVFRISMPEGFAHFFTRYLLDRFSERFPNLWVELVTLPQVNALSRRETDLSVALDPTASSPYHNEPLGDYILKVFAADSYLASAPPIESREDLTRHPFIGYIEEMIFSRGLDYMDEVHPGIRCQFKSSSVFNQMAATVDGHGLAVLPCFLAGRHSELRPVLAREVTLRRTYWLTCHRDVWQSPLARQVGMFLKDAVAAHRPMLLGQVSLSA